LDEALTILDSLSFWTPQELELTGDSPFYGYEYESIMQAELLYASGRFGDALRAYRIMADALFHSGAPAHLRMGQIYERQGKRREAASHYARFVELWKDCDPELRPILEDARRRIQGSPQKL
jgi:tetratricopeptide (TPR) repeat protein